MLCLIDLGWKDLPGLLALVAIVAAVIGYFTRGVKKERGSVKDETIQELRTLCEVHKGKIADLEQGLRGARQEHAACERKINGITAFNLRLQAREVNYQKTINRLELRLGMDPTDFADVSHAPEDSDFG